MRNGRELVQAQKERILAALPAEVAVAIDLWLRRVAAIEI
jgi:hypothetical protein